VFLLGTTLFVVWPNAKCVHSTHFEGKGGVAMTLISPQLANSIVDWGTNSMKTLE
jgi:hypothetical protein